MSFLTSHFPRANRVTPARDAFFNHSQAHFDQITASNHFNTVLKNSVLNREQVDENINLSYLPNNPSKNSPTSESFSMDHILEIMIKLLGIKQAQAAYLEEGQAGHGNVILGENVQLQGYVSDLPINYDIEANRERDQQLGRRCKHININTENEAKVCVGSNNEIPEEGDHDFLLIDNTWYKLRTGDVYISRLEDGKHQIEPAGFDIVPNEVSIFRLDEILGDIKKIPTIIHEAANPDSIGAEIPRIMSDKSKREPVDYLHRLHGESGIGPLPAMPPTWEEIMEDQEKRTREHHERAYKDSLKNMPYITP